MLIKRLILCLTLLISSETLARDLLQVRSSPNQTIYIDTETIEYDGDRATVWSLWNYKFYKINLYHENFNSVLIRNEYNCSQRTVRVIEVVEFSEPMAQGKPLRNYSDLGHDFDRIPYGSIGEKIFEKACPIVSAQKNRLM